MTASNWDDSSTSVADTTLSCWQEHEFDEESSGERSTPTSSLPKQTASFAYKITRTVFLVACSLVVICALLSHWRIKTSFDYYDDPPTSDLFDQTTNSSATPKFNSPSDHPPLLPLQPTDVLGFTLAAFGLILASGGGIGGGGMLVPIYILVMGFLPKHAIPLSNVTVFGGAVANTIINVRKRHPDADR